MIARNRRVADLRLRVAQTVVLTLFLHEISLGNLQLLELGVAGERDDLHAIAQRRRDRVERVGGADEEHLREVERQVEIVIAEVVVLLGIEHFEQRRLRVAAKIGADLVDLVDHHDRIARAGVAHRADDRSGHRADIRAAMPADLGLVVHAADREPHELASHRARDRLAERRLADARRTDEAEDRAGQLLLELADREILDDAILDLVEIVVIFVENRARRFDVDVIGGLGVPRQRHEPIEVRANDAVLRARLRHFRETVELAIGGLLHVFGHRGGVDLRAQFVRLGLLRIDFAELFLNRAQLLAQIELALILLHLALNVALNLVTELDDFELLGEQQRQLAHALCGVALFEQCLPVGGLQAHRRRDEVGQHHRIGDVRDLHLHLARRLRKIGEQLLEEPGEVALHRDELFVLDRCIGQLGIGRDHVRRDLRELLDLEDLLPRDDATQRAVGNLEHLLNDADRSDALNVVGPRVLDLAIAQHDQADRLPFAQRLLDELDAGLLDDRKRNDGVRKEHRLLERQNADLVGGHDGAGIVFGHSF